MRTPSEHYAAADRLLAELEQADPQVAPKLPHVAFKLRLAEIHARLAQSPWWPGLLDDDYEHPDGDQLDILRARIHGPHIETRTATGDML
ncbi:hypothetical protein [Mycobacterium sp. DL440]|uniref:hypothetical protein n=1 Tax=Mycobacterium sp. DL440 TaxID=2675523 RepID=UPI0014235D1B|nr:hypothetical protein [Mycobacterium sp. DL440]